MKTAVIFLIIFVACTSDPVKRALSTAERTANIIYVIPANSAAPDSLNWVKASNMYGLQIDLAKSRLRAGLLHYDSIDAYLLPYKTRYDSVYKKLLSAPRNLGFSIVRYTVNREPDTLTAVLDPSFRVVWPR